MNDNGISLMGYSLLADFPGYLIPTYWWRPAREERDLIAQIRQLGALVDRAPVQGVHGLETVGDVQVRAYFRMTTPLDELLQVTLPRVVAPSTRVRVTAFQDPQDPTTQVISIMVWRPWHAEGAD